jgi:hypothetical protein
MNEEAKIEEFRRSFSGIPAALAFDIENPSLLDNLDNV